MRSLVLILAILPAAQSQCANGVPRLGVCVGGLCPTGHTCDASGANCCQNGPAVTPNPGGGGGCTDTYGQLCTRFSQYCNVYPFSVCMQSDCAQTCGTCGTAAASRGGSGYGGFESFFGFGGPFGLGRRYGYGR